MNTIPFKKHETEQGVCVSCKQFSQDNRVLATLENSRKLIICKNCAKRIKNGSGDLKKEETEMQMEGAKADITMGMCGICEVIKSTGMRTFTINGERMHVCSTCFDRTSISAKEKWTLNQNELNTKKAIEETSERVGTDGEDDSNACR